MAPPPNPNENNEGRDRDDPSPPGAGATPAEEAAPPLTLGEQLVLVSASPEALEMAAQALAETGDVPASLLSWSRAHPSETPVNTASSSHDQWHALLSNLSNDLAEDLIRNIPEGLMEAFRRIINDTWQQHGAPPRQHTDPPFAQVLRQLIRVRPFSN